MNFIKMKYHNKNISKIQWMFIMTIILVAPSVWAQDSKRLDSYLEIAAENNPKLKSMFNRYLAALEEVPQVGTLPDPQVMFGFFVQPVETRVGAQRANLSVTQAFPWFGTLNAREQVAAERAKISLQAFEDAKLELFMQVKVTYNDLYYLQKAIEITRENLQLLASFKELARVNFESGDAGFADVLRIQIEEEELQNKLQYWEDGKEPVMTHFEQLLNKDIQEQVSFPDSLWKEQLLQQKKGIFQTILAENPRLEGVEHEVLAFENQREVAKKMGLPSFTLGASYTNIAPRVDMEMPDNGKDVIVFPQVGIRIPLFRKKYDAMEKQARFQQEASELSKESMEDQLLTELEQLYRDYLNARREIDLFRKLSDLAETTLGLLQSEFSTGETDFEEIIRVERQLLNYRLQLEEARVDQNNYVYSIKYLMGQ